MRTAEGIGPPVPRAAAGAQLPALLAMQEAGDLPGDRAVVHRAWTTTTCAAGPSRRSTRSAGCRTGARRGSRRWSRSGRTGASAGSGPGACRSRRWAARPATPSSSRPRRSATSATCSASHGADAWFTRPVEELLPPGAACPRCGGTSFRKEGDILDVWFESGSSHRAVLSKDFDLGYPGVHVPRRLRPAPRLVPVVDPDGRRDQRHRAVRERADPRVRRRRARGGRSPSRWATTSRPTR